MSENKKHVHAELMLQYAQDALRTDKPYELWEIFDAADGTWEDIFHHPHWHPDFKYRRKPEMITVGKVSFPKPIDYELKEGERYYIPAIICVVETYMYNYHRWSNSIEDFNRSSNGLIHLLKDNAVAHTKALIKISKGEF